MCLSMRSVHNARRLNIYYQKLSLVKNRFKEPLSRAWGYPGAGRHWLDFHSSLYRIFQLKLGKSGCKTDAMLLKFSDDLIRVGKHDIECCLLVR